MATKTKLSLYNEKRNSLQPYIDAGNASTTALKVYPTTSNNMLAKAYSAPKTASTAMPMQSSLQKAYSQPEQQTYTAQASQNVPTATAMNTTTQNTNTPTLQQAYGNTGSYSGSYGTARQNALNQAEASYNKLLNYLPEYMELLGMGGLGVSNKALLNAYGTYQQNVNDINAQYDELERAYRDQQITNASNVYADLSSYITGAGDNFTQEGYEKFKQGLLEAGYTQQEIAAGEKLLQQSDLDSMRNALDAAITDEIKNSLSISGDGVLASTATEQMFGDYYDSGKKGSKQYNLVQDILKAGREGRIPNGTYFDFNYGSGPADDPLYVYYNGYFYPTSYNAMRHPGIDDTAIVGRGSWWTGKNDYIDPNDL